MADDKSKKPKIDLKARLNKTMAAQGGATTSAIPMSQNGSVPPPVVGPPSSNRPSPVGIVPPAGIAPPPGLSPVMPVPPFPISRQQQAPARKPTAQEQTIKVEVGEEIKEKEKAWQKKTMLFVGIGALVGIGIGFVVGGAKSRSDRGKAAVEAAKNLQGDLKSANEAITQLSQELQDAAKQLAGGKFPDEFAGKLGGMNIDFGPEKIEANRNVLGLPGSIAKPLLSFSSSVQEVNEDKDSLRKLLGYTKQPIEEFWKEQKEPKFNFVVLLGNGPKGPMAELVKTKDPFGLKAEKWPESFEVWKAERNAQGQYENKAKPVSRYVKGDAVGGGEKPNALPVEPSSVAPFMGDAIILKVRTSMYELLKKLEGDKSDPTNDTGGLVKQGEVLAEELKKAARAGQ